MICLTTDIQFVLFSQACNFSIISSVTLEAELWPKLIRRVDRTFLTPTSNAWASHYNESFKQLTSESENELINFPLILHLFNHFSSTRIDWCDDSWFLYAKIRRKSFIYSHVEAKLTRWALMIHQQILVFREKQAKQTKVKYLQEVKTFLSSFINISIISFCGSRKVIEPKAK